ncbi:hypothetical protein OAA18_00460 [bacterium]|jgi:hypothetical protein|nr:hypothetical protein [bacterium]
MRNKQLFEQKVDRLEGKLQQIRVMASRVKTLEELYKLLDEGVEIVEDMRNMLERD